jgi:hypothetical protein
LLKNKFTPFGISVRAKLFEIGQTQEWLNEQCRIKTGMYVDSGRMYRVLTGKSKSPRIETAIRETLGMSDEKQADNKI